MPLGKDGELKFVSEFLLQKLMQAEEYANSTSEGYIYHTELDFSLTIRNKAEIELPVGMTST
jgi:hypothetical protein